MNIYTFVEIHAAVFRFAMSTAALQGQTATVRHACHLLTIPVCCRVERSFGKFQRRFALPENINNSNIRAEVKHGELTVTVPKKEPVKQEHTEIPVLDASHSTTDASTAV